MSCPGYQISLKLECPGTENVSKHIIFKFQKINQILKPAKNRSYSFRGGERGGEGGGGGGRLRLRYGARS